MTDREAFLRQLADAEIFDMADHGDLDALDELARRDGDPHGMGSPTGDVLEQVSDDEDAAYLDLLGQREVRDADWRDSI